MAETKAATIPESLIYEMIDGTPLYYKGYRDVLEGTKNLEAVMGSSKIQSYLVGELLFFLRSILGQDYYLFTNELGVLFSKGSWRAADIALVKKGRPFDLDDKYLEIPPDIVFEIDTKGELLDLERPFDYFQNKTDDLLDFGVGTVVWIFTDTQKVLLAKPNQDWIIRDWHQDLEVMDGVVINIGKLLAEFPKKLGEE
jgi:Uma2 family endonuclease